MEFQEVFEEMMAIEYSLLQQLMEIKYNVLIECQEGKTEMKALQLFQVYLMAEEKEREVNESEPESNSSNASSSSSSCSEKEVIDDLDIIQQKKNDIQNVLGLGLVDNLKTGQKKSEVKNAIGQGIADIIKKKSIPLENGTFSQ